jgi:glycosyltransferase involved in cell wall biosynthesis
MNMSATVIIPTTGAPELKKAVDSALKQTYPTTVYVVADGPKAHSAVRMAIGYHDNLYICNLPINVGANGFYGHRVYAAFSHLVNTKYVLYLDQDNWFEPDHVEKCVNTIEKNNLHWCYSLRNIYEGDNFICRDDCESLGKYESYQPGVFHCDTNSYCILTGVAAAVSSAWHGGWGQDRVFYDVMQRNFPKFECTKEYTVNYRVGGNEGSVRKEFFLNGNKIMNDKYNGVFPWQNKI